jgi:hypothetical protein
LFASPAGARDGQILLFHEGGTNYVQILGSGNDDWRLQTSTNLADWTTATAFGTLLSGSESKAPLRAVGNATAAQSFHRALKTGGLYDTTLLRTMSLTFTQANWQALLTSARTAGTNVPCSLLTLDNGVAIPGVGARYRGNTSFTGMGGSAPVKKSVNLEIAYADTNADLMGYDTVNLNNAFQDETIMRETLYFNVMRHYTVCPAGCLMQLYINGANWGVYSFAQQQNGDLIREYFPSNDGDRWRAPNMPAGSGGGGSSSGASALGYLGNTNVSSYTGNYELKSDANANAYPRLINCIYVLNNTASAELRDKVENVLAVDRWLWFMALENLFADDDSYWNKGADYMMYFEPESGRLHPVEHDGNEAFVAGDASLSPVQGASDSTRPVISKLLGVAELRQRYLAHMRTALAEYFNPTVLTPIINSYVGVSVAAIAADPKKGYTAMTTYTNDLLALKTFVTNRYKYLTTHAELTPLAPVIAAVYAPTSNLASGQIPFVTARVTANGANGINSVWLYHRGKSYGRFTASQMFDDGAHGDGAAGDGLFGGATATYAAGSKVRFYVEARSANTAKAASFSPARAEQETYDYRVTLVTAPNTSVVINELMAANQTTLADPQGQYDDWIELHNITEATVDLTGCYLSDEPNNPRKWPFPAGTTIPADGYLLVWADEDGSDSPGLHASFKLAQDGEEVFLIDNDANLNAVLDHVAFGAQPTDRSYGRTAANADEWADLEPTPGQANP